MTKKNFDNLFIVYVFLPKFFIHKISIILHYTYNHGWKPTGDHLYNNAAQLFCLFIFQVTEMSVEEVIISGTTVS